MPKTIKCSKCGSIGYRDRMEKISHNDVAHTAGWCITALNEDNDALSKEIKRLKFGEISITRLDLEDYPSITCVANLLIEADGDQVCLFKFTIYSGKNPISFLSLPYNMAIAYPDHTRKRVLSLCSDLNDYLGDKDDE